MLVIQEYAREMLQKTGQTKLPIQVHEVTDRLGITVQSYSQSKALLCSMQCWEFAQTTKGLSFRVDDAPYICYADSLSIVDRDDTVIHECGHIYLGHLPSEDRILGKSNDLTVRAAQETEANNFAVSALAPPHLLAANGITSSREIPRTCRISKENAIIAAKALSNTVHPMRMLIQYFLPSAIVIAGVSLAIGLMLGVRSTPLPTSSAMPAMVEVSVPISTPLRVADDIAVASVVTQTEEVTMPTSIPVPTAPPAPVATEAPAPTTAPDRTAKSSTVYYWTQGGEVYHIDPDCSALLRATYPVQSGDINEAQTYKPRPCKHCTQK